MSERWSALSKAQLVTVALAPLLGSCLVTGAADYEAVDNPTSLSVVRPIEPVVRLPAVPATCPNSTEPGIAFEVRVSDEDTEQPLFSNLYVNGRAVMGMLKSVPVTGLDERRIRDACLSALELQRSTERCNRVTVVVSSDIDLVQRPPSPDQPNVGVTTLLWLVLNSPLNDPYVSASDCAPPLEVDAGTLP